MVTPRLALQHLLFWELTHSLRPAPAPAAPSPAAARPSPGSPLEGPTTSTPTVRASAGHTQTMSRPRPLPSCVLVRGLVTASQAAGAPAGKDTHFTHTALDRASVHSAGPGSQAGPTASLPTLRSFWAGGESRPVPVSPLLAFPGLWCPGQPQVLSMSTLAPGPGSRAGQGLPGQPGAWPPLCPLPACVWREPAANSCPGLRMGGGRACAQCGVACVLWAPSTGLTWRSGPLCPVPPELCDARLRDPWGWQPGPLLCWHQAAPDCEWTLLRVPDSRRPQGAGASQQSVFLVLWDRQAGPTAQVGP